MPLLPITILHHIALDLLAITPLGPPTLLPTLRLTSRLFSHPDFIKAVFALKFDVRAQERRAYTVRGIDALDQMKRYCAALAVFRRGDVWYHPDYDDEYAADVDVETALWTAYVMLLENDGKNRAQLEHAGVLVFVDRYVRLRMYEGSMGWPLETTETACALWILWMVETDGISILFFTLLSPHLVHRSPASRIARSARTNDRAHSAICASSIPRT